VGKKKIKKTGTVTAKVDETILKNLKGFISDGTDEKEPTDFVPTTHFKLDFILQFGSDPTRVDLNKFEKYDPAIPLGLPMGKLVEVYGEEGGGKSSLAYRVCGSAQKLGYPCAWIDTENSFASHLASINGLDDSSGSGFWYSDLINKQNPNKTYSAEIVLDYIQELCKAGMRVIVLDSVANLVPKEKWEADAEQKQMGLMSRLLSENLGKVVNYASIHNTLIIFINQLREKIGAWGDPKTSPGGRSLKHNAFVRLEVMKKGGKDANIVTVDEDSGEEILLGRYSKVKIIKSKLAKPYFDSIEVPIYYEHYFPDINTIVFDAGRQVKTISVRKGVFSWNNVKTEGRKSFMEDVTSVGLFDTLVNDIKEKAEESGVLLPPELLAYESGPSRSKKEPEEEGSTDE
jgi:recombination protein RecA